MLPLSQVIRNAQSGDPEAIEQLMSYYGGTIRRECDKNGNTKQPDLSASDLSQEVMLQVWLKLHQFRGGDTDEHTERAFDNWIKLTARSVLCNLHRHRSAQKRQPDQDLQTYDEAEPNFEQPADSEPTASSIFIQNENIQRVREAMDHCLDDQARDIVNRHIVDGQTFKDIADELGLTYHQVRHSYNSACVKMERWLSN